MDSASYISDAYRYMYMYVTNIIKGKEAINLRRGKWERFT